MAWWVAPLIMLVGAKMNKSTLAKLQGHCNRISLDTGMFQYVETLYMGAILSFPSLFS